MAPLPVDSTGRYKVFYTNTGHQHTQQWRHSGAPNHTAFETFLTGIWTAMTGQLFPTTIDDVQYAAVGSNIFNSIVMSGFVGSSYGSGTPDNIASTQFVDFVGRSTDGRRVRVQFFGNDTNDESFRFNAGENGNIDATIAALQGNTVSLATIGGLAPVWKGYADVGFNAYWQRNARS